MSPEGMHAERLRGMAESAARLQMPEGADYEAVRDSVEAQVDALYGGRERALAQVEWLNVSFENLRARTEQIRLERVADSGAFVMDDRPEVFDALVLRFVNALVRPGASSSRG